MRVPLVYLTDASQALYPADIALVEDVRGGTLEELLAADPAAAAPVMERLGEMLRSMWGRRAARVGKVADVAEFGDGVIGAPGRLGRLGRRGARGVVGADRAGAGAATAGRRGRPGAERRHRPAAARRDVAGAGRLGAAARLLRPHPRRARPRSRLHRRSRPAGGGRHRGRHVLRRRMGARLPAAALRPRLRVAAGERPRRAPDEPVRAGPRPVADRGAAAAARRRLPGPGGDAGHRRMGGRPGAPHRERGRGREAGVTTGRGGTCRRG